MSSYACAVAMIWSCKYLLARNSWSRSISCSHDASVVGVGFRLTVESFLLTLDAFPPFFLFFSFSPFSWFRRNRPNVYWGVWPVLYYFWVEFQRISWSLSCSWHSAWTNLLICEKTAFERLVLYYEKLWGRLPHVEKKVWRKFCTTGLQDSG